MHILLVFDSLVYFAQIQWLFAAATAALAVVFKSHLSDARGYLQPLYRLGEFIKHGGVAQWVTGW